MRIITKTLSKQVNAYLTGLKVPGTARRIVSAFSRSNPTHKLSIKDFLTPAIAIWGENDAWIPYERMKPLTDELDNVTVVIIKDTGHVPHETDPDLFNRLVLGFLLQ